MNEQVRFQAAFSPDRRHRYWWSVSVPTMFGVLDRAVFLMLNPSTADEHVMDPTVTRCLSFALGWGYGGIEVVNLFGYRATHPEDLQKVDDPVGPENNKAIVSTVLDAPLTVCAWGAGGSLDGRAAVVRELLKAEHPGRLTLKCLGRTQAGEPRHPLYLARDTPLEDYPLEH